MQHYARKLEQPYTHSLYILEFWNTLSNLPFVLIGISRLLEGTLLPGFYCLYILAGLCSATHHAISFRGSLILDWIPISLSLFGIFWYQIWMAITISTATKVLMALMALAVDHIWTPMHVPYGHVVWHILAAFSVDSLYQDATAAAHIRIYLV